MEQRGDDKAIDGQCKSCMTLHGQQPAQPAGRAPAWLVRQYPRHRPYAQGGRPRMFKCAPHLIGIIDVARAQIQIGTGEDSAVGGSSGGSLCVVYTSSSFDL